MRTENEIREARKFIVRQIIKPINFDQRNLLQGMSVALQWACADGGESLQQLLEGMPIFTAKDEG